MQGILFLLGLFAIGCVLYGISAGVQLIRHGFSSLIVGTKRARHDAPSSQSSGAAACISPTVSPRNQGSRSSSPSSTRHGIEELQTLFSLYQLGALTQTEFEGLKRTVLADTTASNVQR